MFFERKDGSYLRDSEVNDVAAELLLGFPRSGRDYNAGKIGVPVMSIGKYLVIEVELCRSSVDDVIGFLGDRGYRPVVDPDLFPHPEG